MGGKIHEVAVAVGRYGIELAGAQALVIHKTTVNMINVLLMSTPAIGLLLP
jgi:hypothetical protein